MTAVETPIPAREQAVGRPLAIVLGLLTIFGPISMDLYLPVLPALTAELQSTTSVAQLTITACLLGLAIGQVVAGPLSDRLGRRTPLLIGVIAYTLTSALCAVSPTVETLIVARFVQGLAGAVGIVIAQAAGRDVYSGAKLLRYYGRLTVLGGLAAIIGPVIGGQLATVTDWRGVFLFLAAVGVAVLLASFMVFGFIAGRLSERWSERGTLTLGLVMTAAGALGLLATALLHLPLMAIVLSLFTMVSGVAVTSPPATSLALKDYPDIAGTASSLLGLARYAFGGIAAPLVGIGGANDAVPFGIVAVVSAAAAVLCLGLVRKERKAPGPK
ncbi:MFS transporter [Pseudarthrobacter sp. Y6]|uniref:MFS transporter n=1 Tax=Pseudarthrobacter sp. Y6 TaxID=3418422 RepID=UPI003CFB6DDC